LLRPPYVAPRVDRGSLRAQHLELCIEFRLLRLRHLSLRPERGLLQVRNLAHCSTYGLLRTFHLVPGDNRGLLRAYHLVLRAGTFWYSLLNPTNEADQVYPELLVPTLRTAHLPRIAPRFDTWRSMLYTDCSVVYIECLALPTDCSVFHATRLISCLDYSLLDTYHLAPCLDCSLPAT